MTAAATVAAPSRLAAAGARIRSLLAIIAGASGALALPPLDVTPVLWIAFTALVLLLDAEAAVAAGRRRAGGFARIGWCFGFGYFLSGLWWIGNAFLVEPEFVYALPLAITALPAGLALYPAAAAAAIAPFWRPGPARILILAVSLAVAEWLRGHLLTGFPWNGFGTAAAATPVTMQAAAVLGAYGLTPVAIVVFAAPAVLADRRRPGRPQILFLAAVALAVAAILGYGAVRLAGASDTTVAGVELRIVQPAIAQEEKWSQGNGWWIFDRLLSATRVPAREGVTTVVIWPESSTPFLLNTAPVALAEIGAALPRGGVLLAGAATGRESADGTTDVYNSILVIDDAGRVISSYDKVHLVPFGEYLPFQAVLEGFGLSQLAVMPGGFSAGAESRPLPVPGAPVAAPLICYEAIFPGAVVPPGPRPGWIVNVTNDAWFGLTPGPYQHLHQARLRAVEEGLPLVRAANTGISAVIDGYGREVAALPLGGQGVLSSTLPAALPPTVYSQFGGWIFLSLVVFLVGVAVSARRAV